VTCPECGEDEFKPISHFIQITTITTPEPCKQWFCFNCGHFEETD